MLSLIYGLDHIEHSVIIRKIELAILAIIDEKDFS